MVKLDDASFFEAIQTAGWNVQQLRRYERPDEYPVEKLPPIILNAVREVREFVQAPMAMIAGCALTAVSAAVQTRFSVRRNEVLVGPPSLYFMTVAESGERKSTVDGLFTKPIRDWEREQERKAKAQQKEYEAELQAWQKCSDPDPDDKPAPPDPVPRILRGDDTPEALAIALSEYPVAAVISAEAGTIFGSHAMNADAVQRNLAQASIMWDSGTIDQGRVSRERLSVSGMRVTMGLQVQPSVLQNFSQKSDGLMRGIGYFARFLFCQPESTMGTRFYQEPPAGTPHLRAFQARVTQLLADEAVLDENGELSTVTVSFDAKARDTWINFHDEIEEKMNDGGLYADIGDVAGKAPENAARLACCLHVFSPATAGAGSIDQLTMNWACSLMRWYLDEALRYVRAHDVTEEVRNAEALEVWLVQRHKANPGAAITVNMVRQRGPNPLRVRAKLDAALDLLIDHGRIRVTKAPGSKREYITIAPAVVLDWS